MSLFPQRSGPDAAVPAPAPLVELVARHPDPALLLAADGALLTANPQAQALLAAGPQGVLWNELLAWLSADAATPFHTATVATERGQATIDWTAVGLPDGTVVLFGRDVTLERTLRTALTESRQRFRDFVDLACDFAWETGPDGRFVYVVPGEALGYAVESLVGQPADLLLAEPGLARSPFEARRPVYAEKLRLLRADGMPVEFIFRARPMLDRRGTWRGVRGVCHRAERSGAERSGAEAPGTEPFGAEAPKAEAPEIGQPGADQDAERKQER